VPLEAQVLVDWLPIGLDQRLVRHATRVRILAADAGDDREPGGRE